MPCRDYYPTEDYTGPLRTKIDEQKRRLDNYAKMLCGLCGKIERTSGISTYTIDSVPGLRDWWEDHKEQDRKRILKEREEEIKREAKRNAKLEKERLKKLALSKLTDEERNALGI